MAGFSYEKINALPVTADLHKEFNPDVTGADQGFFYANTNVTDSSSNDLTLYQDFYYLSYSHIASFLQFQAQDLFSLLSITLGGRFDYSTRYGYTLNPRAGVVIAPTKDLAVKLLYGEAFLSPSPSNTYRHYGSISYNSTNDRLEYSFFRFPNKDLKPEKLRSAEFGLSYIIVENISASGNGYYIWINNLITEESYTGIFKGVPASASGSGIWLVNKGSSYMYGGTVKIDAAFDFFSAISINAYLAYSFSNGKINNVLNEERLPFSAMHSIKSGFELEITKKILLTPSLIFRSTTYNLNNAHNDPYVKITLYAKYYNIFDTESFKLSVFARVTNLLNTEYYNVYASPDEMFFNRTHQDPIRIIGGLSVDF
ncbi:MAG: TonB-dependent receptor [bacterium]|nr:TonB-dependent receptor [bacterium]